MAAQVAIDVEDGMRHVQLLQFLLHGFLEAHRRLLPLVG
jgi:hypothetical protein